MAGRLGCQPAEAARIEGTLAARASGALAQLYWRYEGGAHAAPSATQYPARCLRKSSLNARLILPKEMS